eukprot:gene12919-14154_t
MKEQHAHLPLIHPSTDAWVFNTFSVKKGIELMATQLALPPRRARSDDQEGGLPVRASSPLSEEQRKKISDPSSAESVFVTLTIDAAEDREVRLADNEGAYLEHTWTKKCDGSRDADLLTRSSMMPSVGLSFASCARTTAHDVVGQADGDCKQSSVPSLKYLLHASAAESVFVTLTIDAAEDREVALADIEGALEQHKRERFHSIVAKLLYLSKHGRPYILTAVCFLTTRVLRADEDDWKKLERVVAYLRGTTNLVMNL